MTPFQSEARHIRRVAALGNLILDALPKHEYEVVRNRLSKSALRTAAVLFKANQPVRGVYFPINGLVSCFASNGEGNTVEAYSVGHEGVVELSAILTGRAIVLAKVQIPGAALWIAVDDLYELLRETTVFPRLLLHYACFVLIRSVLGTTCAKFHTVEQRLSLWLLLALERTSTQIIHCTHHALAQILGSRRATV